MNHTLTPSPGADIVASRPAGPTADFRPPTVRPTPPLPRTRTVHWEYPARPDAVGHARSAVARELHAWGLDELSTVAELVISELVTNAVVHAGGPVWVGLISSGDTLEYRVADPGTTPPQLRQADLADEGGRGLHLIDQLTDRWGVETGEPAGKTVWAQQRAALTPEPTSETMTPADPSDREVMA